MQYYVSYIFCNHLGWEKRAVAVLCLLALCLVTVIVLWFFLAMPWIGLQCVIVVFLAHTHLSFINPLLHNQTKAPCDAFEISCI